MSGPTSVTTVWGDPVSCNQAVGSRPTPVVTALTVPMSASNTYMKRQMTDRATKEMAMGMKMAALAGAS